MRRLILTVASVGLLATASAGASERQDRQAHGDVLLIERTEAARQLNAPTRGMSMSQVESRFGAPSSRLDPRGGQKRQWPVIHRWEYPEYTVFFENDRVINIVARQASPEEIGPRPVR
ncbi:MAG: hypothetical protein ACXIUZ_13050 [Lysobacteraceae bacterium]